MLTNRRFALAATLLSVTVAGRSAAAAGAAGRPAAKAPPNFDVRAASAPSSQLPGRPEHCEPHRRRAAAAVVAREQRSPRRGPGDRHGPHREPALRRTHGCVIGGTGEDRDGLGARARRGARPDLRRRGRARHAEDGHRARRAHDDPLPAVGGRHPGVRLRAARRDRRAGPADHGRRLARARPERRLRHAGDLRRGGDGRHQPLGRRRAGPPVASRSAARGARRRSRPATSRGSCSS